MLASDLGAMGERGHGALLLAALQVVVATGLSVVLTLRQSTSCGNVRLRGPVWTRLANSSAYALGLSQGPLMLASSFALVVLSSLAEIGLGEGLLRGHDVGRV